MRVVIGGAITVTATERWLSEIRAGRAFSAGTGVTAVAAQLAYVQLFNPAGSAVTVIARSVLASVNPADTIVWGFYNTALVNLSANGGNLLAGGAANVAELRWTNQAGVVGTAIGSLGALANSPIYMTPDWYVELGAGEGFIVRTNANNIALATTYSWVEV